MPRKATATKTRKAGVSRKAKALTKTKKFGGKTYTKKGCSSTKTGAKSLAAKKRKAGYKARVVKNPNGGYCVYQAGRKKKRA